MTGHPPRRRKTLTSNLRCLAATPIHGKAMGVNPNRKLLASAVNHGIQLFVSRKAPLVRLITLNSLALVFFTAVQVQGVGCNNWCQKWDSQKIITSGVRSGIFRRLHTGDRGKILIAGNLLQ
ncbi:hypothetical protein HELRODRAFT_166837 [Helobdella robusta]|uniref:Uncharacterized protein n=1 Tax=Helobdella robusta TaxID=6412 RepID=T1EYL7_HELRO|nr:hypothetical protein HELRODRAFT_166837 [Helobdella robusta]ESO11792.1 hypothetical protein HELRODRAFT_166837 [Helobdella robusta]